MESRESLLRPGERLDDMRIKDLRVIQNPAYYCFSSDAVLLANFARVRRGECAVDLGTGSGVIALLLALKTEAARITGVEIQPELADMAARSVEYNALAGRVAILNGDMRDCHGTLGCGSADVVTVNPPYRKPGSGEQSRGGSVSAARHEVNITLEEVLASAARLLRFKGRLYMIHQSQRLAEIFALMERYRLAPKTLQIVQPTPEKAPHLALIEAHLGGNSGLTVKKNLIVSETPEVN